MQCLSFWKWRQSCGSYQRKGMNWHLFMKSTSYVREKIRLTRIWYPLIHFFLIFKKLCVLLNSKLNRTLRPNKCYTHDGLKLSPSRKRYFHKWRGNYPYTTQNKNPTVLNSWTSPLGLYVMFPFRAVPEPNVTH